MEFVFVMLLSLLFLDSFEVLFIWGDWLLKKSDNIIF